MTKQEMYKYLEQSTDVKDSEENYYDIFDYALTLAGNAIINKAYPFRDDITTVPVKYHSVQLEIASYLINKSGAEGETSHSENGISRSYESGGIPDSMLTQVIPYGKVIF